MSTTPSSVTKVGRRERFRQSFSKLLSKSPVAQASTSNISQPQVPVTTQAPISQFSLSPATPTPGQSSAPSAPTAPPVALTSQNVAAAVPSPATNVSTSTPSSVTTTATVKDQILTLAWQKLSPQEHEILAQYVPKDAKDVDSAVDLAQIAAKDKQQICLNKQWNFTWRGRRIILRYQADKVVNWLKRFQSIGDIAANADPVHAGLPWVGIRMLLEAAVSDATQMAALLAGFETILYMVARLKQYAVFIRKLPAKATRDNLEEAVTIFYAHILSFLARAIQVYQTSTAKRMLLAFGKVDDVSAFEEKCNDLATQVERDASQCHQSFAIEDRADILKLRQDMQQALTAIRSFHQVTTLLKDIKSKLILDKLPWAEGAIFNSHSNTHSLCHPDTRTDLLKVIQGWAWDPNGKSIFWLHGGAGTGKSTISHTVAHWLNHQGGLGNVDLGASFFFKRNEGGRSSATLMFSTIVRQLVTKIAGLDDLVTEALDLEPLVVSRHFTEQFNRLLLQPLQKLNTTGFTRPTFVVVIDALDECDNSQDIKTILQLWTNIPQISAVDIRLFLTTRPDPPLQQSFQRMLTDLHHDVVLQDIVPLDTIEHDLLVYMRDSFGQIRDNYNGQQLSAICLSDNWPGNEKLRQLVNAAVPLFIVAATICRFVGDDRWDPQERLDEILKQRAMGQMSQMAQTYLPVLEQLVVGVSEQNDRLRLYGEFRIIVGSIICLAEPLSKSSLVALLDVSPDLVQRRLNHLHSVLHVPKESEIDDLIRTLHLSFAEFLMSEELQDEPFGVKSSAAHSLLRTKCLELLSHPQKGLQENICQRQHPGQFRKKINLGLVYEQISPALQYACQYWVHHVQQSLIPICDDDDVHKFLQKHFLHWLEVLALVGHIADAIQCITMLQSLQTMTSGASKLSTLLEDCRRFILMNRYIADLAPLQLYSSATIFAPQTSFVRIVCGSTPSWIKQCPLTPKQWGSETQRLEGHTDSIEAIAFSHDGLLLASGSWDHSVRLWNAKTGQELQKLDGHTSWINTVAFSNDGILASGSADLSISLWDTKTGQQLRVLHGHKDSVRSVVFSSNGVLASGSIDETVRFWNTATGQESRIFNCESAVQTVACALDGKYVGSGTENGIVRIWETATGMELWKIDCDFRVTTLALSCDNLFAAGLGNNTIWLGDINTGQELKIFVAHTDEINTLAFSRDGRLASGSFDASVRLWDVKKGYMLRNFSDLGSKVKSVAFSPTDSVLAMGMRDETIRIQDLTMELEGTVPEAETVKRPEIVFSPDGSLLASTPNPQDSSETRGVGIWDAKSGLEVGKIITSCEVLKFMTFSHDGTLLMWIPEMQPIEVWEWKTGRRVTKIEINDDEVYHIAISHDHSTLAIASKKFAVRAFDLLTGDEVRQFSNNERPSCAVTFSADDSQIFSATESALRSWDFGTGTMLKRFSTASRHLLSMAISSDNTIMAGREDKRKIFILDLATDRIIQEFRLPFPVDKIEFSVDGQTLHTDRGSVQIPWSTDTPDEKSITDSDQQSINGPPRPIIIGPNDGYVINDSDKYSVKDFDEHSMIESDRQSITDLDKHSTSDSDGNSTDGSDMQGSNDADEQSAGELDEQRIGNLDKQRMIEPDEQYEHDSDQRSIGDSDEVNLSDVVFGVVHDWIVQHGRKYLWLPAEYRNYPMAVHGNKVAFQLPSGQVTVLELDASPAWW